MDTSPQGELCYALPPTPDAHSHTLHSVGVGLALPLALSIPYYAPPLRHSPTLTLTHYTSLAAASLAFLLPWQFSQFVLVTQVLSLFVLHCLRVLASSALTAMLLSLSTAFLCNLVLQFGNSLLLTSLLPSSLISCMVSLSP